MYARVLSVVRLVVREIEMWNWYKEYQEIFVCFYACVYI